LDNIDTINRIIAPSRWNPKHVTLFMSNGQKIIEDIRNGRISNNCLRHIKPLEALFEAFGTLYHKEVRDYIFYEKRSTIIKETQLCVLKFANGELWVPAHRKNNPGIVFVRCVKFKRWHSMFTWWLRYPKYGIYLHRRMPFEARDFKIEYLNSDDVNLIVPLGEAK